MAAVPLVKTMYKRIFFTTLLVSLVCRVCLADSIAIKHFVVRENPYGKDEIAVVATDSAANTQENVNGTFTFTFNGFIQELNFSKGVAFYQPKLDKSAFLYLRHTNDAGTHAMLYYIYKHDDKLSPYHISWGWLLAVPLGLILLGYLFKRFIIIAAIIFLVFLYFNHHNGLTVPTFFESIIDGLKNMF